MIFCIRCEYLTTRWNGVKLRDVLSLANSLKCIIYTIKNSRNFVAGPIWTRITRQIYFKLSSLNFQNFHERSPVLCVRSSEKNLKIAAVLRIRHILVQIRIRIHGCVHLTNGFGSCYFCQWPSYLLVTWRMATKTFFCLLLFETTFTSFFKDKKS